MCYTALNLDLKEKSILMMSNEEFDRKMEFLLNQQPRFDAGMEELKEAQKQTEKKLHVFFEGLTELRNLTYDGFKLTAERFEVVARNFEVVSEKFNHTDDRLNALFSNTDAKINALVDSQIQTEEIVRNIGVKLDRYLTEDHNGGPKT
jgi:hypothetical protein